MQRFRVWGELKLLFLGGPAWCLGKGFKGLLGFRKVTSGKRSDE